MLHVQVVFHKYSQKFLVYFWNWAKIRNYYGRILGPGIKMDLEIGIDIIPSI